MRRSRREAREEGRKEGLKLGLQEGLERGKGIEEANMENARKMKAKGYPMEDIADITGISLDVIESL